MRTGDGFGGKGGSHEIKGPKHHPSGGEVQMASRHDAADFSTVQREVEGRLWNTEARDTDETAGAGHVVEASASVPMMAAAGAASNGGSSTAAAIGENMAADANDEERIHEGLRKINLSG